jgi:hypothetical protein
MVHIFEAISKEPRSGSDNKIMARRVTCQWMACVLVLAIGGWHGANAETCLAAAEFPVADEGDEEVPDMNYIKSRAQAGRPQAQTRLADFFVASGDFTNAVIWYRRAAGQDHVPAQLSLAGCLMSGRGVARDPSAAAGLLRRAADLIEGSRTTAPVNPGVAAAEVRTSRIVTKVAAGSIVITRESSADPLKGQASSVVARTNLLSVVPPVAANPAARVDALAVIAPVLQDSRPNVAPPPDRP